MWTPPPIYKHCNNRTLITSPKNPFSPFLGPSLFVRNGFVKVSPDLLPCSFSSRTLLLSSRELSYETASKLRLKLSMGWQVPLQGNGGSQTHLGGPAPFRYRYLVGVWIWMSDNRCLTQVGLMGLLWKWMRGRWEGGLGWGIYVNPWLINVNVWQKPLQYRKEISLQLIKINEKKKKENEWSNT